MGKLELHMKNETTCRNLQEEFWISYPYLKIEFQKYQRTFEGRTIRTEKLLPGEKMLSFCRKPQLNSINVGSDRTVLQVIKEFEDVLYLKLLLLRRSGNSWIETTLTTDWTLEQQNREGRSLSQ